METILDHEKFKPHGWLAKKMSKTEAANITTLISSPIQLLIELVPGWNQDPSLESYIREKGSASIAIPGMNEVARTPFSEDTLPFLLNSEFVVSIQEDHCLNAFQSPLFPEPADGAIPNISNLEAKEHAQSEAKALINPHNHKGML